MKGLRKIIILFAVIFITGIMAFAHYIDRYLDEPKTVQKENPCKSADKEQVNKELKYS